MTPEHSRGLLERFRQFFLTIFGVPGSHPDEHGGWKRRHLEPYLVPDPDRVCVSRRWPDRPGRARVRLRLTGEVRRLDQFFIVALPSVVQVSAGGRKGDLVRFRVGGRSGSRTRTRGRRVSGGVWPAEIGTNEEGAAASRCRQAAHPGRRDPLVRPRQADPSAPSRPPRMAARAHDGRAPRGLPLLLRGEGPPALPVVPADPARRRPLDALHSARDAAADAVLPRPRDAARAADDDVRRRSSARPTSTRSGSTRTT